MGRGWLWGKGRRGVRRDGAWRLSPWENGALSEREVDVFGWVVEFVMPVDM